MAFGDEVRYVDKCVYIFFCIYLVYGICESRAKGLNKYIQLEHTRFGGGIWIGKKHSIRISSTLVCVCVRVSVYIQSLPYIPFTITFGRC